MTRGSKSLKIADAPGLREATLRQDVTNILQNLNVRKRVATAILGREKGMEGARIRPFPTLVRELRSTSGHDEAAADLAS